MIASVRSMRCHSLLPIQLAIGGMRAPHRIQPALLQKSACSALTVVAPPATASAASACAWPTATTEVMRVLPIHQRPAALGCALVLGLSCPLAAQTQLESFAGRYQTKSSDCRFMPTNGQKRGCRLIQIDGRTPAIISIRFVGAGDQPGSSQRLTFVVSELSTSPVLKCSRGNCQLKTANWQGRINSVAEANYDADGLARGLPKAWAVSQGNCSGQVGRIVCHADAPEGGQVSAEAQL